MPDSYIYYEIRFLKHELPLLSPKNIASVVLACLVQLNLAGQTAFNSNTYDSELLNKFILREVNQHRKKAKASPLVNDSLLKPAADDHAKYMQAEDKSTHFQKDKEKKTPKNRVDYYGEQFAIVGENVQQTWMTIKGKHEIKTYEKMAEVLVDGWRNSPPHYANMISEDYTTTYTSIAIGPDGKIYGCQLFGSDAYKNSYRDSVLNYVYKPTRNARCKRCERKMLVGNIGVVEDGLIVYSGVAPRFRTKFIHRAFRFNRWSYGMAADIVLKDQYDCDTNNVFNGKTGVRGIPLEPVFKKDFRKGDNVYFWKFIYVNLGTVPEWIDQDYEVNLTLINNKRTCRPVISNIIPSEFQVDMDMNLYLDSLDRFYRVPVIDTFTYRIQFDKSVDEVHDSLLKPMRMFVLQNLENIYAIRIAGKSSIEGSTESNAKLYTSRAMVISEDLMELGVDSSLLSIAYEENYQDFKKDIEGTRYDYLLAKKDQEIKSEVNRSLSGELEYLLMKHRYAEVMIAEQRHELRTFTRDSIYRRFALGLESGDINECKQMQALEYNLATNEEISVQDIRNFKVPGEKKYVDLLCDRYLMIYWLDSSNTGAIKEFEDSLISLKKLDGQNKRINTNLALIHYPEWLSRSHKESKKYFDTLLTAKYMDPIIKSRMILNFAANLDMRMALRGKKVRSKKLLYGTVKPFIKSAKLNVSETFELASYYSYFGDYHFAYDLCRKVAHRSSVPEEVVFFLKLIYYLDKSLTEKVVLQHFKHCAVQGR